MPWAWVALGAQGAPLSPGARREFIVAEPSSTLPASTFIVRFWRDRSGDESRWRGQIQHVQSGESASCLDLETIVDFIQRLGVMTNALSERRDAGV
jgi:hypothetical protein